MENILEMTNVTKRYKDFSLKPMNLSLQRGYIMGFIGPNGAGKSTTIKLLMNLVKKDSGQIKLFGLDADKHALAVKEKIGFVYDENHFYEELTAQEMKNMVRPFYRKWDEDAFQKHVKNFQLPLTKPIKLLSKGMKMKFSLAVALSHHAELLIMDEPTSGLDPLVRSELLDTLQSIIQDENKSVFFSTHITSDLDKIADFITMIHDGQIILSETKDVLLEDHSIVKGNREALDRLDRDQLIGLKESGYGFEALVKANRETVKRLVSSVIVEKPTLEQMMLFLIKGRESRVPSH